jgi:probable HAF family extracellular repeat protein
LTLSLAVLPLLFAAPATAQVAVTDIGDTNNRGSSGFGINHSGDVAGAAFFSGSIGTPNGPGSEPFLTHGVLYSKGALHDLGAIEGFSGCSSLGCQSEAFGVNDVDWVVGFTDAGTRGTLPVVWLPEAFGSLSAGINLLPALDPNNGSAVLGINNSGQAVGFSKLPGFRPRAALWDFNSGSAILKDLGTFRADNGGSAIATAINDLGQVVGQAADENFAQPVFLYLPEPAYGLPTGMNNITPSNNFGAEAAGINNKGQVTGDILGVPFVWLPTAAYGQPAGFSTLAPTQKLASFVPAGISDDGQIVGNAEVIVNPSTNERKRVPAAWRNGRWVFLNDLLPKGSPWTLLDATGVTHVGKTTLITGQGALTGTSDANGLTELHGYVLSVTCTGDLNDDGTVNQADVDLLLAQFGQLVSPGTGGDLNDDGIVNQTDLLLLAKQISQPCL